MLRTPVTLLFVMEAPLAVAGERISHIEENPATAPRDR
jgi:hypothetical protein